MDSQHASIWVTDGGGGTFAAIWDDVLPSVPEEIWRTNQAAVADAIAGEMR